MLSCLLLFRCDGCIEHQPYQLESMSASRTRERQRQGITKHKCSTNSSSIKSITHAIYVTSGCSDHAGSVACALGMAPMFPLLGCQAADSKPIPVNKTNSFNANFQAPRFSQQCWSSCSSSSMMLLYTNHGPIHAVSTMNHMSIVQHIQCMAGPHLQNHPLCVKA